MNPYKLKNVFEYLTSNNQLLKKKLKLGTSEIPIPDKRPDVIDIEAINRFTKANPRVDTTNLKPLSVKQSNVKQSNVDQADEGVIQGAFDTATREAQSEGFPAPKYEAFKKRYLRKNMKADGGRIGYKDGPKMFDVQASGSKSGKQQIENAPEGITSDKETINAILTMDIPLTEKVNLIGNLKYGKFRDKIEYKDNEIFLEDPASYKNRNIGLDYNRGGEGFSGSATVGDEGPEFNIRYKKSFADGGRIGYKYGTVPGEGNSKISYDPETDIYRKKVQETIDGKKTNKYIYSKPGDSLEDLKKTTANYSTELAAKRTDKFTKEIVDARSKIDSWTSNWLNNNLKNYGVKDFEKMTNQLKKDWKKESKKISTNKIKTTTESGFPNLSTTKGKESAVSKNPFSYDNVTFYTPENPSGMDKYKAQWKKIFYKNKIQTTPGLKENVKKYFDFINLDKRGAAGGQTIESFKNILDKDVLFLLSEKDSGLQKGSKFEVFNSFDDLAKSYNEFTAKINRSETWKENANLIEKELGLKKNSIKNSMVKEQKAAAKFFGLNDLKGTGLEYSIEHGQGLSAAARSGNKDLMRTALNDLIGTTKMQNTAAGFGGFEATRGALIRDIEAGVNVKDNVSSLNKLTKDAYKDLGVKSNIYSIKDGKLTSKPITTATTQADRFTQYAETIYKDPKGKTAIDKKFGNLDNAIRAIGCPNGVLKASTGANCLIKGRELINSGMKNASPAQVKNFTAFLNRAGNIGRGIMKFGIIPEAMFAAADSLVRMGMGDTFKEAGLRATDYLLPGDQTKAAEISKVSRVFGDTTGELVGRTIDYKNQLAKIQSLEDQKVNFENLSDGGEFDYIGDLSGDVKNTENLLSQAKNDLDNKFKISEAEQIFAERKQEEAYDASSANSPFTKLKARFRDSSDGLSDIETLGAPEKTQMQLNLDMLPTVPRDYMTATDDQIINFVNKENLLRGEKQNPQLYIDERDKLKKDFMTKGPAVYGAEQVYGTQGTFGGQPLAKGGIASLTKTIPPASGPTPHGLPSLTKRGIKIKE